MSRATRTYAPLMEDVVKAPRKDWTGLDLPDDVKPRDDQFWHPSYCYEVRNLRIRRSKMMTNNGNLPSLTKPHVIFGKSVSNM